MGNWKTDLNQLIAKHFEFPSACRGFMGVRKLAGPQFSRAAACDLPPLSEAHPASCSDVFMPITRRFEPQPAALEKLIEVLRELLVDAPANEPQPAQRPCVSAAHE